MKITSTEQEPSVLKEVINVLSKIYQSDCYTGFKIYNVMVQVVFRGPGGVQEEAVKFWEGVTRKHLEKQGFNYPQLVNHTNSNAISRYDG